jgi:FkbM family methyltransferase
MGLKETFEDAYQNWRFGGWPISKSGEGSFLEETEELRQQIKHLVKEKGIKTVVDIPCGDFNWMKELVYSFEKYTGGDIVSQAIQDNQKYSNSVIDFMEFDLTKDEIPEADLLIVRDVIGHLSLEDGQRIIKNILKSKCKYLLSTTWYHLDDENYFKSHINKDGEADLENQLNTGTAYFYPVCLHSEPFNLPQPEFYFEEKPKVDGYENGVRKGLGFWDLHKLKNQLNAPKESFPSEPDMIVKCLHHLGKNYPDDLFVQIGAMNGVDFDDTQWARNSFNWKALLVEPIPDIFNELKENCKHKEGYIFEQAAITNFDGEVEMLTIPLDVLEREELHAGYKGMSALYPLRNGFNGALQHDADIRDKFGVNIKVPALTLESLFKKHNVDSIGLFVCDAEGYDWEVFKQLDLFKYKPKFIRVEHSSLTNEEKQLVCDKLREANYIIDIQWGDIDAVASDIWYEIKIKETPIMNIEPINSLESIKNQLKVLSKEEKTHLVEYLTLPQPIEPTSDLTVVTGLWNIGRPGRDFSHYIEHFKNFLEIPVNMYIYIPKEYEYLVWEKRSKVNTFVRIFELDTIKDNLYQPFWDKTQEIRTNPEWLNQTGPGGWLPGSPQASLEWYNPIVQSKMFMLHDAKVMNVFDTNYFLWLDAGITNTVYEKYFTDNRCFDKIIPYLKTFLFLSYPYEANNEIHGFEFNAMNRYAREKVTYVCRGGLFGGHKDFLGQANATYYSLLQDTLDSGYMGTEESLFSIMAHLEPHIYRRYALDDNGLVVKFTEALVNDTVVLENNSTRAHVLPKGSYNETTDKTSLYMLTFNFPQQIEHTLATWEAASSDWLSKPTYKILIDNSTDPQARIDNKIVADKYGFEHIVMNENKGINGGRLFAAEHFDQSDSDYYFFFEDDMGFNPSTDNGFCRNGFRKYVPGLYKQVHEIMAKEDFDFLKLSYTEVYMDNNIQVSWYNVPQDYRTFLWPDYDQLPISGLDPYAPRTKFDKIEVHNELSYISGEIYYANWPMIVNRKGNKKMFLDIKWDHPYEQTWMSYMFQETVKGNLKPAVLLASPIWHNRIIYYKPEERREN